MTAREVELVGGPCDGDVRAVDADADVLLVRFGPTWRELPELDTEGEGVVVLCTGIYLAPADPLGHQWHWAGWRE